MIDPFMISSGSLPCSQTIKLTFSRSYMTAKNIACICVSLLTFYNHIHMIS
jgi:hypothetical protein